MKRSIFVLATLLAACGHAASAPTAPVAPPAGETPPPVASSSPPSRPAWKNPGGMWLPQQLPAFADTLRAIGVELDPATLGDPARDPLAAIVNLGGCSAAFVSADGLIVTNHHCAQGALQYNATPEKNVIETGFLAAARTDERWAGPASRVFVTQKYTDVTATMTDGLADISDDLARRTALATREKQLVAGCEKDRPGLRCRVADFFAGGQYLLIEQLEIPDVRLVYAPARGVGNFGGEVDNWRWPRHTGDFAFFRAYVGADGKPATHADANVPYKAAHFLRVAKTPLRDGDAVLVAGYPGSTSRLATSIQLADAAGREMPRAVALYQQYLGVLDAAIAGRPELAIKAEPKKRWLNNYLTKNRGQMETINKGNLVGQRAREDAELRAWISADPGRESKYGAAFDKLAALERTHLEGAEADQAFAELTLGTSVRYTERRTPVTLLAATIAIARLAGERGKNDAERAADFQERNWPRLVQEQEAFDKVYARELDRATFRMFIGRALALPPSQQPALLKKILPGKRDDKAIDAALDKLYKGTKLEDVKARTALVQNATLATLRKSKDPFVQLALAALPELDAADARRGAYEGARALHAPLYVAALREQRGGALAPDANATLRVTFGTVQPAPAGGRSFTTLTELLAKVTGEAPFDAPAGLAAAVKAGKLGPYVAEDLGDVPVDFMSDLDITNGNSGSSTINGRGELVGLAFDGTYEGVASDWLYLAGISRTIHVDIRYALWIMDAVDGADALLEELGQKNMIAPAL